MVMIQKEQGRIQYAIGLVATVLLMLGMQTAVWAKDITDEFKDVNLKARVLSETGDPRGDGTIYDTDVASITFFDVSHSGISDLSGIAHFTALEELKCGNNQLTALNVTANTALKTLWCDNNRLTALDLSANTELTRLSCTRNNMASVSDVNGWERFFNLDGTALVPEFSFLPQNPTVTSVTVNPSAINLSPGDYYWFAAEVIGTNNPGQGVTWSLEGSMPENNEPTSSVSEGRLFVSPGETAETLTVRAASIADPTVSGTAMVIVGNNSDIIHVTGILLNPSNLTLDVSSNSHPKQATLTATVTPENATHKLVKWHTSDTAIVAVNEAGVVTAIAPGTATITVQNETYGDDNAIFTASCTVTVINSSHSLYDGLEALLDKDAPAIYTALGAMDNNELARAMLNDSKTLEVIKQLEARYKELLNITVTHNTENSPFSNQGYGQGGLFIPVGAAFNTPPSESKNLVLNISNPKDNISLSGLAYNISTAVRMDITLENAVDPSNLNFPVLMTFPIPSGLTSEGLAVIQYRNGRWQEVPISVNHNANNVTFVATAFSPWAIVNKPNRVEITPSSPSLTPGSGLQFTARVVNASGSPVATQSVVWQMSGSSLSNISSGGFLTVHPGENVSLLNIRATSTLDASVYGVATVTILRGSTGTTIYATPTATPRPTPYDTVRRPYVSAPTESEPASDAAPAQEPEPEPEPISVPTPEPDAVRATQVNGRRVNFQQPPVNIYGTTFIPIRDMFQLLNFSVEWDEELNEAMMKNGKTIITVAEGDSYFFKNGYASRLSSPAQRINGHLMIPFEEILHSIGVVAYRDENNVLYVFHSYTD